MSAATLSIALCQHSKQFSILGVLRIAILLSALIFLTIFSLVIQNQSPTTITFLHFKSARNRWWAMRQMRSAHTTLASVPGLIFYKMLGSGGGNGFSILPDLSVYAFLGVWRTKSDADFFLSNHAFSQQTYTRSQQQWTLFLQPTQVKGSWEGQQPFPVNKQSAPDGPIAVLTRATIYPHKLISFWRQVPNVSSRLEYHQAGLLFSKGIGEIPLLQQATFSLWKNRDAMVDYAYRGAKHREIIRKTQEMGWYKEELFAEFVPTESRGNWPEASEYLSAQENILTVAG